MTVFSVSSRSFKRGLLTTSLLAGALIALPALPAHAVPESLAAVNGAFTGTPGNDTLIIGIDGLDLTNNGFALGAPGFESALDFDSTVEGVQNLARPLTDTGAMPLSFTSGDGDDVLKLVGEAMVTPFSSIDLGAGSDAIDGSELFGAVHLTTNVAWQTVEVAKGGSFGNTINANAGGAHTHAVTMYGKGADDVLIGSNGNDVIFGGAGSNTIGGRGGDDTMVVEMWGPISMLPLDGGAGNDMLIGMGGQGEDNFEIAGYPGNFYMFNLVNTTLGYHASNTERARFDLGNGNDFVFLSESLATTGVIGGAGTDQVIVDAFKSTATVSTVGSLKRISIPLATSTPIVNLSGVEQYAPANETVIGTAPTPGGGPHVRTFRIDGTNVANFYAYDAAFTGGVTLALGDLDANADDEIITAAGPGGGPHVRVFYSNGDDTGVSFYAYDPSFNGGVSVAAIDLNGDGYDEIVTAPAKNSQPHVRIFDLNGELIGEWLAEGFGNNGLTVSRGARQGQYGGDQILLSAADGEQSVVRAFEADGTPAPQYDAYAPFGAFAGGSSVSRGEFKGVNGNSDLLLSDEIITGAGKGGGPVVRVVQRASTGRVLNTIGSFTAYDPAYTGGIEVSACNPNGGNDEIVTVPAHGAAPFVRIFNLNGSVHRRGFLAYGVNFTNGIHVVCGGAISRFFGSSAQSAQTVSAQSTRPTGVSRESFPAK